MLEGLGFGRRLDRTGSPSSAESTSSTSGHDMGTGDGEVVACAPERGIGQYEVRTRPRRGGRSMPRGRSRPDPSTSVRPALRRLRSAATTERRRDRIVEYGTAVEAANWSTLEWARWLIRRDSAEVLSTEMRVTCSIDGVRAAALIAMLCRTPLMPIDPIAMNTARMPSSGLATSCGSKRRVARMESPSGSPRVRRRSSESRTSAWRRSLRRSSCSAGLGVEERVEVCRETLVVLEQEPVRGVGIDPHSSVRNQPG